MSHIIVPAAKVIKCCENFILSRSIRRCRNAAEVLKREAAQKQYWFFGKPIGYKKAYEWYCNASPLDTMKYWACFWEDEKDEYAKNLLTLAKHGDPVMLTDKHAFILEYEGV